MDANNKHILFVAYDLNPTVGSEAGAADLWLRAIARRYPVTVVTDAIHAPDLDPAAYPGAKLHYVQVPPLLRRAALLLGPGQDYRLFFRAAAPLLARLTAARRYALMHCITPNGIFAYNDGHRYGLPMLIGPLGGGLPTPRGFEAVFAAERLRNVLREIAYRRLTSHPAWRRYFEKAARIIVGTEHVRALLPEPARDRCRVIFDVAVDTGQFTPPPERSGAGPMKVLYAGSLESKKGVLLLVEAARRCVAGGFRDFTIEFAGSGVLAGRARRAAAPWDREGRLRFPGRVPRPDLIRRYQQSDLFCLPTLREPGGSVILEAMACGLPVVTSDYGGPAVSVDATSGVKIPMTDAETYTRDLSRTLADLGGDPDRRRRLGRGARARATAHFSLAVLERRIEALYAELLGGEAQP